MSSRRGRGGGEEEVDYYYPRAILARHTPPYTHTHTLNRNPVPRNFLPVTPPVWRIPQMNLLANSCAISSDHSMREMELR